MAVVDHALSSVLNIVGYPTNYFSEYTKYSPPFVKECLQKTHISLIGRYRRFINTVKVRTKLERFGFEAIFFMERTVFSKANDSDSILLRCVARLK